jgi:hypothetical protein
MLQIEEEIRRLHDVEKIKDRVLKEDTFIEQPQYAELKKAFRLSKYADHGWEWHQLVRVVLESPEIRQYMYDRLLSLLLKHRRSHEDYFVLKAQEGIFQIPNPLADLNKLEILYKKYFEIYKNIKDRIHFDYPKDEYVGPVIKGRINWDRTIRNSPTRFPMEFVSSIQQKEFETSENILLVLCAEWMYREANRLLQIEYDEPITDYKKNLLRNIIQKTKLILDSFPFTNVLNASKRFWNLSYSDPRIKLLEKTTEQRIKQKLIRNPNYAKLLEWIKDFRELDISRISAKTPSRHILDSIENLDTVYEVWIFLEFVEFLAERKILTNFQIGNNPKCEFEYDGTVVTFWYEKGFSFGKHAWVKEHYPDFTAMVGGEIIAVFDAKNYAKAHSISDTLNKMLAYMNNLDTSFGALIYPYHPENWNDLDHARRIEKLTELLRKSDIPESEIRGTARRLAQSSWDELPAEYRKPNLVPRALDKFDQTDRIVRFHRNQTLCLLRMQPENTSIAIKWKNESLEEIFKAIVSRIPLAVKN